MGWGRGRVGAEVGRAGGGGGRMRMRGVNTTVNRYQRFGLCWMVINEKRQAHEMKRDGTSARLFSCECERVDIYLQALEINK